MHPSAVPTLELPDPIPESLGRPPSPAVLLRRIDQIWRNFTADEVAELYRQHTGETGQVFTADATARAAVANA